MLASLHAPQSDGGLIAAGYAMFFGGLLMMGARLGDRYGHRRTILVSLAVFAAGSAVAATSSSVVALTAGRCLQGAAAAVSVPSALRLLTTITAEGAARRQAIAAWSAAGAAAGATGFVAGGIITELANWRLVFWAFIPGAAVLGAVIAATVHPYGDSEPVRSLNLAASAALTGAVMALVVGCTVITQSAWAAVGAAALGLCAVLTVAFVLIDRNAAAPLLPRQLVGRPTLRQGALGGFLNTSTTSSAVTLVTLYLRNTRHRTPLEAAATLLPLSLAAIAGSWLSATGLTVIAAGDTALIASAGSGWGVPLCAAACGVGIGLSSVAATAWGPTSVHAGVVAHPASSTPPPR